MDNNVFRRRLDAVLYYVNNKSSLRKTAQQFNINYRTLFKWVQLYKEGGETRLLASYKIPWNRLNRDTEHKIVTLKEQYPDITIRAAHDMLTRNGVAISQKGIWGVWRRYGYAGYKREDISTDFTRYAPRTREAEEKLKQATQLFSAGKIKESAAILNTIPFLPQNEILASIPENLLNISRRIEKIGTSFGIVALPQYLKQLRFLYEELIKKNMFYSALRVGIIELLALEWSQQPDIQLRRIQELQKLLGRCTDCSSYLLFDIRFIIRISEGIAYAELGQVTKARRIARLCSQMLVHRKHTPRELIFDLGALYTYLEEYRKSEMLVRPLLENADPEARRRLIGGFTKTLFSTGQHKELNKLLKSGEFDGWGMKPQFLVFRAFELLLNGQPQEAIDVSMQTLTLAKEEDINAFIYNASMIIACAYCCMGEPDHALRILKRLIPFFERKNIRKFIPEIRNSIELITKAEIPAQDSRNMFPSERIAYLMRRNDYARAYAYARKKGLLIAFYRHSFFYPDIITSRLKKGKSVNLPKRVLMMPIFNHANPVYRIKMMGKFVIYRDEKFARAKLQPKHRAFITHFAFRAGAPGKTVPLEELYQNFWADNQSPSRNLSHLLVYIKKELKIPTHLLAISTRRGNCVIINRGIYFTLDYHEFEEALGRAHAFIRADEWNLARAEFLHAFDLWRGEPFTKMYDTWSEDFRAVARNKYENEIIECIKECMSRKDYKTLHSVLERSEKIIKDNPIYLELRSKAQEMAVHD